MASDPFIPEAGPRIRSGRRPPAALTTIDPADLPTVQRAPFKRLKMRHRKVIAAHLQGASNGEIAVALGCSNAYISYVLNNPTVTPILQRCYDDYEREFQALTPLCIAALRSNLECEEGVLQLKAVDLTFKRQGAYDKEQDMGTTAEDVIEKILKITGRDGSRLEFKERRFLKAGSQPNQSGLEPDHEIIEV